MTSMRSRLLRLFFFHFLILTIGCEKKNGPVAVSVAPDSGSGSSQTFVIKFSHKGGYRQFSDVRLLINAQVAGDNACYVYYSLPTNSFLLVNDAGNGSTSAVLGSGTICSRIVNAGSSPKAQMRLETVQVSQSVYPFNLSRLSPVKRN